MLQTIGEDPDAALGASVNYMMLTGYVCGGWQMARAALAARSRRGSGTDEDFCRAKIATASFYAEQILPKETPCWLRSKVAPPPHWHWRRSSFDRLLRHR